MISVRTHSSKNTFFQHFIFTVCGTNELELMHLIPITDTAWRGPSIGFLQVELGRVGKHKEVRKSWERPV